MATTPPTSSIPFPISSTASGFTIGFDIGFGIACGIGAAGVLLGLGQLGIELISKKSEDVATEATKKYNAIPIQNSDFVDLKRFRSLWRLLKKKKGDCINLVVDTCGGNSFNCDIIVQTLLGYRRSQPKGDRAILRALIPHQASSAGLFVALAADEIHYAIESIVSPIDVQMWCQNAPSAAPQHLISFGGGGGGGGGGGSGSCGCGSDDHAKLDIFGAQKPKESIDSKTPLQLHDHVNLKLAQSLVVLDKRMFDMVAVSHEWSTEQKRAITQQLRNPILHHSTVYSAAILRETITASSPTVAAFATCPAWVYPLIR